MKFGDMEGIVDEEFGNEAPAQNRIASIDNPEFVRFCDMARKQAKEIHDTSVWDDDKMCVGHVSDSGGSESDGEGHKLKPENWLQYYDVGLCGRLGLYCYNFQEGTHYEFDFVSKVHESFQGSTLTKLFITLEAVNPADNSPFTLKMCAKHDDLAESVHLWWETCICSVEGSQEADHEWDNAAVDDWYKGELPKWLSDDNQQQCYVLEDSELNDMDNEWLPLFTEFAFYAKWIGPFMPREIAQCLPLEIQEVVVETRGEAETEPREKLKAANAIFYISFECGDDPVTGKEANYRAVVRKTMDGKPGHMRLEVRCWSI